MASIKQIGINNKFIFNDQAWVLKEIRKDGAMCMRLHDNHLFTLQLNTEIGVIKEIKKVI